MRKKSPTLDLSVIIPCCNEMDNIPRLYQNLKTQLPNAPLIFIDDGSTDETLEEIKSLVSKDSHVSYISFSKNFGLDAAYYAGFTYAQTPWTLQIDADMQSSPEEIPKLMSAVENDIDIVFARRVDRKDSTIKRYGSTIQHWLAKNIFLIPFPIGASTFRLVRTDAAKRVIKRKTAYPYFLAEALQIGLRYVFVDVSHAPRKAGESKFNLRKSISASLRLFLGYSTVPLKFISIAFLLILILMPFFPIFTLFFGLLLLMLCVGIQSIYIAKIAAEQSFDRPFYVRETNMDIASEDRLYDPLNKVQNKNKTPK